MLNFNCIPERKKKKEKKKIIHAAVARIHYPYIVRKNIGRETLSTHRNHYTESSVFPSLANVRQRASDVEAVN